MAFFLDGGKVLYLNILPAQEEGVEVQEMGGDSYSLDEAYSDRP